MMNQAVMDLLDKAGEQVDRVQKAIESEEYARNAYLNGISPYDVFFTDEEERFMRVFQRCFEDACGSDTEKMANIVAALPEDKGLNELADLFEEWMKLEEEIKNG